MHIKVSRGKIQYSIKIKNKLAEKNNILTLWFNGLKRQNRFTKKQEHHRPHWERMGSLL